MCKKLQLLGDWNPKYNFVPQTRYRGFVHGPHWGTSVPEPPDWPMFILSPSRGIVPPFEKKFQKSHPPKKKKIGRERRTRGTNSWLDDTDKKLVPICLYCLNCPKFGQLIIRKIIKIVATRCQILKLKCTNSTSAGAPSQTPLGELTTLPQAP